jgi:Transposase DDE domain
VIDATGLKVYGAGEWLTQRHGDRGRRTWRKLHLAVDPESGEILASELTTTEEGDAAAWFRICHFWVTRAHGERRPGHRQVGGLPGRVGARSRPG